GLSLVLVPTAVGQAGLAGEGLALGRIAAKRSVQRNPLVEAGPAVRNELALGELGPGADLEQVEQAFRTLIVAQLAEAQRFLCGIGSARQSGVARAQRVELVDGVHDLAVGVDDGLAILFQRLALLRVRCVYA